MGVKEILAQVDAQRTKTCKDCGETKTVDCFKNIYHGQVCKSCLNNRTYQRNKQRKKFVQDVKVKSLVFKVIQEYDRKCKTGIKCSVEDLIEYVKSNYTNDLEDYKND